VHKLTILRYLLTKRHSKGKRVAKAKHGSKGRSKGGKKLGMQTHFCKIQATHSLVQVETHFDEDSPSGEDDHSGEDTSKEEALQLDCALPIRGVNWPVAVSVTTTWNEFLSTIANKLNVGTEEITFSYRFSSFTASENSEVLCTRDNHQAMITKAKDFLTRKQRVRGGKPFRVHLELIFKNHPPMPAAEADSSKKQTGKVSCIFIISFHGCNVEKEGKEKN
jgi:hypothetical protein